MTLVVASNHGYDAIACDTPLEVIRTLVNDGDLVAYAIVPPDASWSAGLIEFLEDEYPHVGRISDRAAAA